MPPKRGNAKSKAETAVASDAAVDEAPGLNEAPAKKRSGKAGKAAETKPAVEDVKNNGADESVKNGTGKRGRKAKDIGNGDAKAENDAEAPEEAKQEEEPKAPAKRGRKPKDAAADKQPASKKAKSEESQAESNVDDAKVSDEDEPEPEAAAPKGKRGGRKPVEKKSEPKVKNTKAKKGKEEIEEQDEDEAAVEVLSDEAEAEVEVEAKPAKRGRGAARKEKAPAKDEAESEEPAEKTAKKRGANKADDEPAAKRKTGKPLLNKASTDYDTIDFGCSKTTTSGKPWNFKISNWNVDGIRAWLNKGGLEYINYEKPDILCLQETKCSKEKLPQEVTSLPGYHQYWLAGDQEGYAGVGIYTKKMAINVTYGLGDPSLDTEGRIITAEYRQFYLVCTYVPNAGRGLVTLPKRLQWNDIFRKHVKSLDAKKPVIICGDMNVSHLEIDLANPKTNKKNAGFTQEERAGMTDLLNDGFVDTFRNLYPDKTSSYTFWTYMSNCRAKNVGWRLDYALVSERLMASVCDNIIRTQVFGSDHCPITLFLHLNGVEKVDD